MGTVRELPIEPLTEEAFAPFGQIISAKERAPDYRTESGTEGWAVDFRSGRPLVMLLRTQYQGLRFSKLERHFELTQTFLPLGGSPAVVAVAPPSSDRAAIPDPAEVRAFLLDGTKGYALAPGTWHSLDRFPLYSPDTRWVIITDHETQQDLLTAYSGKGGWKLTQEADYRARFDLTFALTLGADPAGAPPEWAGRRG
jgi:ureidoglycolate lyase